MRKAPGAFSRGFVEAVQGMRGNSADGEGSVGEMQLSEAAPGDGGGERKGDSETRRSRKRTKAAKIPFRVLRSPSCHS
jgi:hypothetical protein